jgi:hypothetical protein
MTSAAAPAAPRPVGTRLEWLADQAGPIVVKELRQGLRGRVFPIFFGVLLVACFAAAMVVFGASAARQRGLGQTTLAVYLGALAVMNCFVLPFTAFRALLREREDETWVLLLLTGLGTRRVVYGKWLSAMFQALLYGSACAPFVVFSYFLNGVDLLQVVVALALLVSWTALAVALALGLASQTQLKRSRAGAQLSALAALALFTMMAVGFTTALAMEGAKLLHNTGFPQFCLFCGVFPVGLTVLSLEGAAAGLAMPSEGASKGPRVALLALMLTSWASLGASVVAWHAPSKIVEMATVLNGLLLVTVGMFFISERDGFSPHVRVTGWLRPGAKRSFGLMLGLLLGSSVVMGLLAVFTATGSRTDEEVLALGLATPLYPLLYLSLGVVVGRATPLARFGEPSATRAGFLVMTALGVVLPRLLVQLMGGHDNRALVLALSPVEGMFLLMDGRARFGHLALIALPTVLCTLQAWLTLRARDEARP